MTMMNFMVLGIGALFSLNAAGQECAAQCGDVLKFAPFNTSSTVQNNKASDSFKKLLCTAKWSSSAEVQSAGVDLTIPIFDIPTPINANWDTSKREAWQEKNCSAEERKADYQAALSIALSNVDPNVVPAWSQCVQRICAPQSLSCTSEMTGNVATLKLKWLQALGEKSDAAPKVSKFVAHGMTCSEPLKERSRIFAGGNVVSCRVKNQDDSNVFVVETDRGTCVQALTADNYDRVIAGVQRLTGPTQLEAGRILFKSDAKIITDGYDLMIKAKRIDIEGVPQIITYTNDRASRPAGDNGRPGGRIAIEAQELRGSTLRIENFGEDGSKGAQGVQGNQGAVGSSGGQRNYRPLSGCDGGSPGGPGGQGGQGGQGGTGGKGGDGGTVYYAIGAGLGSGPIKRLDIVQTRLDRKNQTVVCNGTCGGLGGLGGDGGVGGPGGPGGPGAGGWAMCGGTHGGPTGASGPSGPVGAEGAIGNPGTITATSLSSH